MFVSMALGHQRQTDHWDVNEYMSDQHRQPQPYHHPHNRHQTFRRRCESISAPSPPIVGLPPGWENYPEEELNPGSPIVIPPFIIYNNFYYYKNCK